MSAPAVDLRLHLDYWIGDYGTTQTGILGAALAPQKAYRRGTVPGLDGVGGTTPTSYAIVDLRRRGYTPQAMDRHADTSSWMLSVLAVGRFVDDVANMLAAVNEVLEERLATIGGHTSTPLEFDPAGSVAPSFKSGIASGSASYTYVL